MTDETGGLARTPTVGERIRDESGAVIGRIDAVFADYVLVRTRGIPPVDLYVPVNELSVRDGGFSVDATRSSAYERWHRPMRKAPHP